MPDADDPDADTPTSDDSTQHRDTRNSTSDPGAGQGAEAFPLGPDEPDAAHLRRTRIALVSSLTAVISLVGGWTLAGAVQPGYDPVRESISALAANGMPHRWIMTFALALTGLSHMVSAWALTPVRRAGRVTLALSGLGVMAVSAVPMIDRNHTGAPHYLLAAAAFIGLSVWPWLGARRHHGPRLLAPEIARAATVVMVALTIGLTIAQRTTFWGTYERVVAAVQALWPVLVAASVWRWSGRPRWSALARGGLAFVLLSSVAFAGGVSATILAPVTVKTGYYQARITLSPDVAGPARVHVPTVLGDLDVHFSGFAPGVIVQPQVSDSVVELLAQPRLDVDQLKLSTEQVGSATGDAIRGVVLRFMVGAALGLAIALIGYTVVTQRRPGSRLLGVSALAWLVATIGTGSAMGSTYQTSRGTQLSTTGLLTTAWSHRNVLADVEARSEQVSPYVRNLLALSAALQQDYSPTPITAPVAVRLVLVSDIHDQNQYAMLKSIIETEQIDAVLDTGDLVTFGTAQEAQRAGLLKGIASLDVPYIFTRGNHDATGPSDTGVLDALAQVPNVILLQPNARTYRQVDLGGVTVSGFNDPRWYGDSGGRQIPLEQRARDEFVATFAARFGTSQTVPGTMDLVMSHEPWAVEGITGAGVLVNGHMHNTELIGNRIQAGSFTGGGAFSHFAGAGTGEELIGQPSAFDILSFGTTCRLTSLTRYQFNNVVEGRPAFDSVILVNGATIDKRAVDPLRTCTPGTAPITSTVPTAASGQQTAGATAETP